MNIEATGQAGAVVDSVCSLFRERIELDPHATLEPFLARVAEEFRQPLLSRLLEIELTSRSSRGDHPPIDEYHSRFPANTGVVEAVWHRVVAPRPGKQPADAWATVGVAPAPAVLRRLGDYELLEQIGAGGMGVVYRARHVRLGQTVAVKVLPDRCLDDARAVARFEREMQAVGALDHPNIVKALNAGEDRGTHFLVMEFVDGLSLDKLVTRAVPLHVGAACELVRQAALGLEHSHSQGLVHRDIKPGNMIVSRQGILKILDMGLARFLHDDAESPLTGSGAAMGTPDFMAPEQSNDVAAVDIRADIYSLGCTLYYLLAGRPPYSGPGRETYGKKFVAHATAPLPSLTAARPDCPEDVERILFHMMAKEPDDRFDTPGDVVDAIGLFADSFALATVLDTIGMHTPGRAAMRQGLVGSTHDTAPRSRGGTTRRLALRVGVMLVGLVGLAAGYAVMWRSPPVDRGRLRHADEICVLPGLNGDWWFDEMPRFLPFVRAVIAADVRDGRIGGPAAHGTASGGNPALDPRRGQAWLLDRMNEVASRPVFTPAQRALMERLQQMSQSSVGGDGMPAALRGACDEFARSLDGASALDLHTLAVLHHALAQKDMNSESAAAALEEYGRAEAAYNGAGAALDSLRRLCLMDEGWCRAQFDGDSKSMTACFERALEGEDDPFIAAQVLTARGRAACVKDRYGEGDDAYKQAAIAFGKSDIADGHPLVASLAERHAFSLLYQWKVVEAEKLFEKAISVRSLLSGHDASDMARLFVLHARHGLAMAYRYHGQPADARSEFDKVLRDDALRDLDDTGDRSAAPPRTATPLLRKQRERAFNSRERRADCELYGGAASLADVDLGRACRLYHEAHDLAAAQGPVAQLAMALKLTIALALDRQASQARDWLSKANDMYARTNRESDRRRIDMLAAVATAAVALQAAESVADGRRQLQELLADMVNPESPDRCEVQELHLLAAEMLLASSLRAGDREAAKEEARHLGLAIQRILDSFRDVDTEEELKRDLRPYMRRLCEIMVEANLPDAKRAAQVVRFSRHQKPAQRSASLVFFFQDHHVVKQSNVALLETAEGRWSVFELDGVSRDAVLEELVTVPLPSELVARCREMAAAGSTPDISWSDEAAWADPARAIARRHWPTAWGDALGFAPDSP